MNTFSLFRILAALPLLFLCAAPICRAAPVTADPQALALLQEVQTATQKTHSLTADVMSDSIITLQPKGSKSEMRLLGTVWVMKPNYQREQSWQLHKNSITGRWEKSKASMMTASNGYKTWWPLGTGQYSVEKTDPQGHNLNASLPSRDFFNPAMSVLAQVKKQQAENHLLALTYAGIRNWEGQPYRIIEWYHVADYKLSEELMKNVPGGVLMLRERIYIGSDNLIRRTETAYNNGWSGGEALRHIRVNVPLTAANFKFTPPPGAHLPVPPSPLLAIGTPAPDFAAIAPDGSTVHLSDHKGKVVVLDFWSTWCGPCQMSMPHLEKVYQAVKDKNVAVLGVCVYDERSAYDKWVTAKKDTYHFPTAFDPAGRSPKSIASTLYRASSIPTQYVIDRDGNIAASTVGYEEGGTFLEDVLHKLGTDILTPTVHK